MIYVDSSVVLAHLLSATRAPSAALWNESLISSRLLLYEVWNRLHAKQLSRTHGEVAQTVLGRLLLLELSPAVLARALEPFPGQVRTLDALHLASVEFLRSRSQTLKLATYDRQMADAAAALEIPLADV